MQTVHRHTPDFLLDVMNGIQAGHRVVSKLGSSTAVTSGGYTVISHGETYQVPTVAQSLEFVSAAIGDALNGTGMLSLTIEGLGADFVHKAITVPAHATNGTIAVAIPGTWLRVYDAYVETSASYATLLVPSHLGQITIRNAGAGVVWAKIDGVALDIPHGRAQIGAHTVPKGETAYLNGVTVHTETNKPVNVFGFERSDANILTAPFGVMKIFTEILGVDGVSSPNKKSWYGPFPEYTDFGFLAKTIQAGPSNVAVDFETIFIKNQWD